MDMVISTASGVMSLFMVVMMKVQVCLREEDSEFQQEGKPNKALASRAELHQKSSFMAEQEDMSDGPRIPSSS